MTKHLAPAALMRSGDSSAAYPFPELPRQPVHRLAIAVLLGLACSDDPETTAPLECDFDQDVYVNVEQDVVTRFTWEPACGMASIMVAGGGGGWVLYSGEDAYRNPIASGVTYGIPPAGTLEPSPATPLQSGEEYQVRARATSRQNEPT